MAHRLRIEAVHSKTSSEIHMSHKTHPSCQEPSVTNYIVLKRQCRGNIKIKRTVKKDKQRKSILYWHTRVSIIRKALRLMTT